MLRPGNFIKIEMGHLVTPEAPFALALTFMKVRRLSDCRRSSTAAMITCGKAVPARIW
jgi:hypothetical protein